uniref:Uncharacterized protein n=2 Tax=Hemiselmis andersenii TaxID=464988 RepID=A0A6U4NQ56_HEMAN
MRGCAAVLLLLAAHLALADGQAVRCPELDKLAPTKGHFISASISWTKDMEGPENSVIFEIVSTWRRNHTWPCNPAVGFTGDDGRPGLGDVVPIVGISVPDATASDPLQRADGQLSSRLVTGDMRPGTQDAANYDIRMKVTSFSMAEDWISGVSYVHHTYSAPYAGKTPFYPAKYVASVDNKETSQPYNTVPWTATFSSCCRQFPTAGGALTFSLETTVDLSDMMGSPRIASLPVLWLSSSVPNEVYLCAVPSAGRMSLTRMSGGTLNDESDDGSAAQWSWEVVAGEGGAQAAFPDPPIPTSVFVSGQCSRVRMSTVYTAAIEGIWDHVKIRSRLGSASATADLQIRVLPTAAAAAAAGVAVPKQRSNPFQCTQTDSCQMTVSLGLPIDGAIGSSETRVFSGGMSFFHEPTAPQTPLEVRYTVTRGGMQTSLMATSDARIKYSTTLSGMDHAGLPRGAELSPMSSVPGAERACSAQVAGCPANDASTSCKYVTGVEVSFSAGAANSRPLQDVPISAEGRDYQAVVGDGDRQVEAMRAGGFQHVVGSDFNGMSGGARVGLWLKRDVEERAITEVRLANSSQVQAAMDAGFHLLDKNLLEQSGRGSLFVMFKRGSSAPILDVRSSPPVTCGECYECDGFWNQTGQLVAANGGYMRVRGESWTPRGVAVVDLWVKKGSEREVRRKFGWTPCTGDDEDWVVCAQGAQTMGALSTPMQCILMRVYPKPPPEFFDGVSLSGAVSRPDEDGVHVAYMGKRIVLQLDIRQRSARLGEDVVIEFAEGGVPQDRDDIGNLITERTPTGIFVTGSPTGGPPAEGEVSVLQTRQTGDNPSQTESQGFVVWTPSPYQGGWSGHVCVRACTEASACPAVRGEGGRLCSPPKCFAVRVERCKWQVQNEDSFTTVAPRFQTSWLQLWYANPMIRHPDFSLQALPSVGGDLINVGRVYKARWDDTVRTVTERFGVTTARLLDLNHDLAVRAMGMEGGVEAMEVDQTVCIIPDSCTIDEPSNSGRNE